MLQKIECQHLATVWPDSGQTLPYFHDPWDDYKPLV